MNLWQKLNEIRKTIDKFDKDGEGYNFSYVTGSQALGKIKSKMEELQVILKVETVPQTHKYEIFQYDTKDKNGNTKHNIDFLTSGEMKYTWINAEKPDEREECNWNYFGQQDEISKSFGSGLTYSERYFILKSSGAPTDEDDPDKKPKKEPVKQQYTKTTKQETTDNGAKASEKQIKLITDKAIEKNIDLAKIMIDNSVNSLTDLTVAQASKIINELMAKANG